ncbi:MAG: extracellular solute-binding protein [Oscillospiraceae bacterium]|jgi:putative aldouronate transport system substrate-binding protein|nr:extracellular solute-binding protein [Oscillospiraceae bacterium]
MKRIIALCLTLVLMFTLLAAPIPAHTEAEADPYYIEGGAGTTLTFWMPMNYYQSLYFQDMNEHPFFKFMEEKTGVHINFIHPAEEQAEQQLTLMVSSGNYYDLLMDAWYPGGPEAAVDDGAFLDLALYLDEYMPNYKAAATNADGSFSDWEWKPEEKELFQIKPEEPFMPVFTTVKGYVWCVGQVWNSQLEADSGPVIRKDWLDEAGLAMPETIDELEAVLEAFKQRGVIPMTIEPLGYSTSYFSNALTSAWNLDGMYASLEPDGKTVSDHLFIQPAFRDYLAKLADWYAKGYIDPDFMNADEDTNASKMLSDELGVWMNFYGDPSYYAEYYVGDQAFNMEPMPLPRLSKDQTLRWHQKYVVEPYTWITVSPTCKTPEIAAQWLDKWYLPESILRLSYGIEGETYEMADGVPMFLPEFFTDEDVPADAAVQTKLWLSSPGYYSYRSQLLQYNSGDSSTLSPMNIASQVWSQNAEPTMRVPYTLFSDDDWGEMEEYIIEVYTYAEPMILKFITGQESLDKFDEFVQTCKDLGIEEATAMWQDAVNVALELQEAAAE